MRNRSDKWKSLAVRGRFRTEAKLIDGDGTVFTRISAPEITRNVMTSPLAIGNSTAATLSVSILMKDTDKVVSPVDVQIRLSDGTKDPDSLTESDYSEWLTMGTFFIDSRDTDSEPVYEPIYDEDGKLTDSVGYQLVKLTAYDALLKTSSVYYNINNPATSSFPKTMKTLVEEIAERIDVEIDPRTAAGMKSWDSSVYVISEQPVDTTTMQTLLQDVAKCFGGSWIVTPENKLRLVTITDSPKETNYVVSSDYERIELPGGVNLADDILVHAENPTDFSVEQWESVMHVPVVCGTISTGVQQTIVGVSCKAGSTTYTAGQEGNSKTGAYQLSITSTYADQNVCDNLYKTFNGMVYNPYTATKTRYDPAAELGDSVYISTKVWSVLYSETVKYDIDFSSDISAPTSQSLYSEYPYETAASKIQQVKQDIQQTSTDLSTTKTELTSKIEKTEESLTSTISKKTDGEYIVSQINQTADGVTISGNKIDITGNTTFSSLTTTENGKTVIDGGSISTGSITTDKIAVGAITVKYENDALIAVSGDSEITLVSKSSNGNLVYGGTNNNTQFIGIRNQTPLWSSSQEEMASGTTLNLDLTTYNALLIGCKEYYTSFFDGGTSTSLQYSVVSLNGTWQKIVYAWDYERIRFVAPASDKKSITFWEGGYYKPKSSFGVSYCDYTKNTACCVPQVIYGLY